MRSLFLLVPFFGALCFAKDSNDATGLTVTGRDHFNEEGFPELIFGSHAAAIAAYTYYIVIFLKIFLLIHLGLVRQREAETHWSRRSYEDHRYLVYRNGMEALGLNE